VSNLATHFQNLLQAPLSHNTISFALPQTEDFDLDRDITEEEVSRVIERAKNNKAPGYDCIPVEFFKNATPLFLTMLTIAFNCILNTGQVPLSFKQSIIFPLFKTGDPQNPENYRGIAFLNAIYKIFAGVILDRLTKWVERENLLSEFQTGFRKGYSTMDNIFCLTSIARIYQKMGKTLYAFFCRFQSRI